MKLNGNTAVYNEYTFKIHGFKRVITWMRVNDFLICRQGYDSQRFGEVDFFKFSKDFQQMPNGHYLCVKEIAFVAAVWKKTRGRGSREVDTTYLAF